MTLTYSLSDLAVASLAAAVVAAWAAVAGGAFSVRALVACEAAFLAFYLVGSLFAAWDALAAGALFDLPLRLLMGYAAVNTALLVLAWLSPLGIVANFVHPVRRRGRAVRRRADRSGKRGERIPSVSWSSACRWPPPRSGARTRSTRRAVDGNTVAFKPWIDGFYHAVHLRIFGAAHGASTIEDFRMAGVPARLYHYGAYMTPAFIRQASGLRSYAAFAGILAPMGVFFTGLGAYALFGSFWGSWPGLAAAAALLLLPDGAQQGMQNTFMSYHWLTQISPSASYGLALLALAWLFVLLGCTQGSRLQLVTGWLIAGVLAVYKLHFFIASALLLLLVPALFFRGRPGGAAQASPVGAVGRRGVRRDHRDRPAGARRSHHPVRRLGRRRDLHADQAVRPARARCVTSSTVASGRSIPCSRTWPSARLMSCSRRSGSSRRCW